MTREAEIKERLEKAIPGPYEVDKNGAGTPMLVFNDGKNAIGTIHGQSGIELPVEATAVMLANAPEDLRYLLGRVEKLEKALGNVVRHSDGYNIDGTKRKYDAEGEAMCGVNWIKVIGDARAALEREGGV